ncbi:MAG TPA: ferrochelatase [Gammaproteobacteria bacterium]|nr:ferrochelatase [Gammaproteobacteria bacterium]
MPELNKQASEARAFPGVLVTNLGTPDAPTPAALRRYLAEFLADPDVVNLPRLIWLPLLYGVVLPFRPKRSAEAYARIWTPAGSPLLIQSKAIAAALSKELAKRVGKKVPLALGMRYGNPSLPDALLELAAEGVTCIVVLPLYPQYARATVGSTVTRLKHLSTPTLACIEGYCRYPAYINALTSNVRSYWEKHGRGQMLLISFHGIPKQVALKGDPYADQCMETARLLAANLGLHDDDWQLTFQSRFGKAEWLQPYTDIRLQELAVRGVKIVDVVCPGFAADCLETLEEIALRYAESFAAAGGEKLRYIPALNDRPEHIQALAELVMARFAD